VGLAHFYADTHPHRDRVCHTITLPDDHSHAIAHPDGYFCPDGHSHADLHAPAYRVAYAHANSAGITHADTHLDSGISYFHTHVHTDAFSHTDADSHSDAYAYADSYPNTHVDADSDANHLRRLTRSPVFTRT
jgi:hypothetical protein